MLPTSLGSFSFYSFSFYSFSFYSFSFYSFSFYSFSFYSFSLYSFSFYSFSLYSFSFYSFSFYFVLILISYAEVAIQFEKIIYMLLCFRDRPLITCGEGVEDFLIYFMEFSSLSHIYVNILIPLQDFRRNYIALLFKCFYFCSPSQMSSTPPLEELMSGPLCCCSLRSNRTMSTPNTLFKLYQFNYIYFRKTVFSPSTEIF